VTGKPPFHRPSEVAVLNAHLHAPPPQVSKEAPEVPAALDPVISKALSKSPLDRYATPGELVAAGKAAAAEHHVRPRRLAASIALLLVTALAGAGIALGISSLVSSSGGETTTRTVGLVPPKPVFDPEQLLKLEDGRSLNDIAFILIGAHRYRTALPFAKKAVRNTHDYPVHAFAMFNLGYVYLRLGNCKKALPLLRAALPHEPREQQEYVRNRISYAKRVACPR
jgi:tetratricopeptide (TPR) repeat protein